MRGEAARDDKFIDVARLFRYASDRVPELSKDTGGLQRPVSVAPVGKSFNIGMLTKKTAAQIKLGAAKRSCSVHALSTPRRSTTI